MNRLAEESSPYLRQHADNPVHWYPWGDEAFAVARAEDKPVFLSVGYASCHWCHVMAHESFEDPEVAKLMNDGFVNVKVDREERPDIDAVYMEATQAMTGQGGWPMSVFLDADRRPFLAGTYFPRQPMGQLPTFTDVLAAVRSAWVDQRAELDAQASQLQRAIAERTTTSATDVDIARQGAQWVAAAKTQLLGSYDPQWGGFGTAPKFPQTTALELLLRDGEEQSTQAVINTLDAMASGGIYDHVGGGFHRYSVDAFWMVPHFEKMLYDQAAFVRAYTHAFQKTGHDRFRQVVEETVAYVRRDLTSSGGGFFSSEDADSEGEEGTFYVWRAEQIEAAAGDSTIAMALIDWFGVTSSGNFEGSNILHRPTRGDLVREVTVDEGCKRLFGAREQRPRPALDDKVLTEWNAMFIAALCEAGTAMERPDWIDAARQAAEFLLERLREADGRWLRSWQETTGARHHAYANDYAWLVDAFTRLSEATGESRWRELAQTTAQEMIDLFWDHEHGGLFTTGQDAERMIVHSKDLFDGATNSANSTAAVALVRLARLSGDRQWQERAEQIVALVAEALAGHPTAFTNIAIAVDMIIGNGTETVIAGDRPDLVATVWEQYLPDNVLLWGERDDSPLWEGRHDGAFVCWGTTCGPVAHTPDALLALLKR